MARYWLIWLPCRNKKDTGIYSQYHLGDGVLPTELCWGVEVAEGRKLSPRHVIQSVVSFSGLFSSLSLQGQIKITNDVTTDPTAAKFVYDDVHNFIRLEKSLIPESDIEAVLKAEYFGMRSEERR